MGEFKEFKDAFYKEIIARGVSEPSQIKQAFPLGYSIPEKKLYSWLSKMNKLPDFSSQRRYVNRYKLGADPEFVFIEGRGDPDDERRVDASTLGMKQGQAFGADNNGRLAEIRPHPSRSALKVCASVMNTLRWMNTVYPNLQQLKWKSGAYIHGDGIGGHVHFGRKRPTRKTEVAALDVLSEMLLAMGVYPLREVQQRRQGDRLHQIYGMPGDFRLQTHGYEYRTFPSWLDSPGLAFITLTLAKLAVFNPDLLLSFPVTGSLLHAQRIKNLLSYYKEIDDDALLACHLLRKWNRIPRHEGGDFKAAWGISPTPAIKKVPKFIPQSIPASLEDVDEMFRHLSTGERLAFNPPSVTWSPLNPPANYHMLLERTNTHGMKGLGELIWDLCVNKSQMLEIHGCARIPYALSITRSLVNTLDKNWRSKLDPSMPVRVMIDDGVPYIQISPDWREGERAKRTRAALLSGVFPIWKIHNVASDSVKEWAGGLEVRTKQEFAKCRILYQKGMMY